MASHYIQLVIIPAGAGKVFFEPEKDRDKEVTVYQGWTRCDDHSEPPMS